VAENLSLPRRWKRLPKALTDAEIQNLLEPEQPETPQSLCDQAILELAYASGLRLSELKNLRLEQLHLDAGFINVIGKGNKERVVPVGRNATTALNRFIEAGRPKLVTPRSPAAVFLTQRGTPFASVTLWLRIKNRVRRAGISRNTPVGARRGFARDPGITRAREHQHHGDLHPCHGEPAAGHPSEISSPVLSRPSLRFIAGACDSSAA
jgi:integrase/recombinase XerD